MIIGANDGVSFDSIFELVKKLHVYGIAIEPVQEYYDLLVENLKEYNCIKNNCEKSIFKSISYALRNYWARIRRQYFDNIDKYLCLTEFQRNKLVKKKK